MVNHAEYVGLIRSLIINDKYMLNAKKIITLLKKNDITVSYNDKMKSGGRSLKIYSHGSEGRRRLHISKVKKLLANKKNVTIKTWSNGPSRWSYGDVIRIHVK